MVATETLIQEILRSPGSEITPRNSNGLPWMAAPAADPDSSWEWYDSSYDLQAGLDVTEHEIPAALCAAVFQHAQRRYLAAQR